MDWLGLRGRTALEAGGGGIGGAVAAALIAAGASVVVADVDQGRLDALDGITPLLADLTTAEGSRECVVKAASTLGGLDVFVHAVGTNDRRPVLDTPDDVREKIVALNLSSAFWTGQAVGELMVGAGYGRVVYLILRREEESETIVSIACPVFGKDDEAVAVLGVLVPTRVAQPRRLGLAVQTAARSISRELGAHRSMGS